MFPRAAGSAEPRAPKGRRGEKQDPQHPWFADTTLSRTRQSNRRPGINPPAAADPEMSERAETPTARPRREPRRAAWRGRG